MALKLIRRPWGRQPLGAAGINWGHPRAEGLVFFAPLSGAHGTRDLAAEQLGTRTGLEAYLPSQAGAIHHLFGTSNFVDFPTVPSAIGSTTPFTVAWTQEPRSTSGFATPLAVNFGSGTNSFAIYQSQSDATYVFVVGPRGTGGGNSFVPSFNSVGNLVDNQLDRFVLQVINGSQSSGVVDYVLWRNGVRFTTASTATFGSHTSAIFRVGARETGADPFEGLIGDLRMWSRVLSDGEAEAESTLPEAYALYAPQRIWVPAVVAGGAYTLTAEQGSYTLTGQAAGTLYSRSMPADQGSYALTGQAAGLAKGILLTADQGSYALSGQAANFSLAYLLAAAQGSYTLTGQSAGTLYSPLLAAAQGSYALTGQDATLTYAPAGAYSMPADQGSYTLTGQDAALKLSALLVAVQGSYALTGQAAALSFGKVMAAAQGSYTLSGQAAAFSRTYALSAAFGSYTLSGQVATLTYAGLIAVFLETVRLRSRITQAIFAPSRITQQLALRSQVRH